MTLVNQDNVTAIRQAYQQGVVTGPFAPAVYVLEVTNRCNVDCVMCPQSRIPTSSHGDMAVPRAAEIAEAIAPYAELIMLYFMGEPTIHPELPAIIREVRVRTRARIVVSTNALHLPGPVLDTLTGGDVDLVIACIDRWEPREYERIRRGSNFAQVQVNVERLVEKARGSDTRVLVKALDIGMETEEQDAFRAYWESRGASALVGWVDTWAGQFPNLAKLSAAAAPYAGSARKPCADLWFKMVLNVQGTAVLCCHDWASTQRFGKLRSPRDLVDIWQGDEIRKLRAAHLAAQYESHPLCHRCREWGELPELDAYVDIESPDWFLVF